MLFRLRSRQGIGLASECPAIVPGMSRPTDTGRTRSAKIPNSKSQENPKPNPKPSRVLEYLGLGAWDFLGIWDLRFGVALKFGFCSLEFSCRRLILREIGLRYCTDH